MIDALLAIAVALPLALLVRRAGDRRGVRVDHVVLFSFGYLFYWMLPAAAGRLPRVENSTPARIWYRLFDYIPDRSLLFYLSTCALMYGAFWLGSWVYRAAIPARQPPRALRYDPRLLNFLFVPCVVLAAGLAYGLRDQFLAGYGAVIGTESATRGTLLATSLLVLSLMLLYGERPASARDGPPRPPASARALFATPWGVFYTLLSLVLTTLGGRMTFVTGAVALVAYWSVYVRPLPRLRLLAAGVAGVLAAGVVGGIRFGLSASAFSATSVLFNIAAEPVFTSYSLMNFLIAGRLEVLNAPVVLGSQFINLVPTFLVPNKVSLMVDPVQLGYSVTSPFGALSSYVSFLVNFGAAGSAVVLFFMALGLEYLRHRGTAFARVAYAMTCGFIPFAFFRDPFYYSIVKSMVQLSLLMPAAVVALLHVMTAVAERARGGAGAPIAEPAAR